MARNVTIRDIDAGWSHITESFSHFDGAGVEVGIFDEDGAHPNGNGRLISEIALDNELGTDDIPARPFMATTYSQHQERFADRAKKVFAAVLRRRMDMNAAMTALGAIQVTTVKKVINDWTTPPNSPATVAIKGRNDPLVDSRVMRDSVKFKRVQQ